MCSLMSLFPKAFIEMFYFFVKCFFGAKFYFGFCG